MLVIQSLGKKMGKEIQKIDNMYQADVRLLLLYMLPDICECLIADIDDYRKKAEAPPLQFKKKLAWKAFFKASGELRGFINQEDYDYQESYSDMCDLFQTLLLSAIDRCNDSNTVNLRRFIEYIQSFPSIKNIEIK